MSCHSLAGLSLAQCLQAAVSAWFGVSVVSVSCTQGRSFACLSGGRLPSLPDLIQLSLSF